MSDIIIKNTVDNVTKILQGQMQDLETVNKETLVKAINEVKGLIPEVGDSIGKKGTGENSEIFNNYEGDKENAALGNNSHAEGEVTVAKGTASHAEGGNTKAEGNNSHAEGVATQAIGVASHAEGGGTMSSGGTSHAEGDSTTASGQSSHAEGAYTTAKGICSHVEGKYSRAEGNNSHAEGEVTVAKGENQHVQGRYNITDTQGIYAHIVGNGKTGNDSNAHTLDWDGNSWYQGNIKIGGTSYDDTEAKTVATEKTISTTVTDNNLVLSHNTDTRLTSSDIATLSLSLPTTIPDNYECYFSFKSGETATTLTYASNIRWVGADCDSAKTFVPVANVIYEVGLKKVGDDSEGSSIIVARVGVC